MARKLPKIISQEEFEKLFVEIQKREKKTKSNGMKLRLRKYRIAILLGFEAGLRISEIVGHKGVSRRQNKKTGEIKVTPINIPALTPDKITSASIRIDSGKGGKDRIVPRPKRLNENAVKLLPLKIKRRGLQKFTTKIGQQILHKEISFHTFRHGFGSHLASKGRPLHEIQMLMGHSRLDTTGIYLHANPEQAIKSAQDVF